MIRIDPADAGDAVVAARQLAELSRRKLARNIADATGRSRESVCNQLAGWELGQVSPTLASLGPLLDALGYDLALVPRKDASRVEVHCEACGGPCRDEGDLALIPREDA